ncbi:hypothetical protein CS542_06055 [Pedobacter sp. IW39]|nr:hypothetical protein CS542_06055 [Pedobacter sp. IW39]
MIRVNISVLPFGLAYPFVLLLNVLFIIWVLKGRIVFALGTAAIIAIGWHPCYSWFYRESGDGEIGS